MLLIKKHTLLLITGLLALILFNANKSTASQKWVKVITDEDQIANYLDLNSIQNQGREKSYTTARISPKQVTNDEEMFLRRPYHGQRCPCPYDFAINESHCGGRASGKTTCFAPIKAQKLLVSNSVNCKTRVRSILKIDVYDIKDKLITTYSADTITGGAYPVGVEVSDRAELSIIKAVCKK
ncbi:hypothetical protein H6G96_29120 [Nostoc sp. FACHB-892]|uniref:hypothetical protein n=1 Tax=Nostoc sp. FACHB-892 TaxID=2692843 RepID=UPI00168656DA|nr:hypothetical protein [Nostoc sp. FACHB-892]MBD2730268.1 hypothetical protein [Nostoc sp. FACHB-892]